MPASASSLGVITGYNSFPCLSLYDRLDVFSHSQASPSSTVSLDPSRRIVVQRHLTCPVIMLCTGNSFERMAVVGMSASRWMKIRLHLPYSLEISLAETTTNVHISATSVNAVRTAEHCDLLRRCQLHHSLVPAGRVEYLYVTRNHLFTFSSFLPLPTLSGKFQLLIFIRSLSTWYYF